jgi:osmotically-inducible protein OsmY
VRKSIADDTTFSSDARACSVTTVGGVVTLRGKVANQAERAALEAKARAVPGVTSVVNQLEVPPK